jgi:hypothetical protein
MSERAGDPRAEALADYLRQRASAFSLSADATGEQHIATAGMSLLDAAALAESLPPTGWRRCPGRAGSRPCAGGT